MKSITGLKVGDLSQERQGEIFIFSEALLWSLFPVITVLSLGSFSPVVALGWSTLFAAVFFGIILAVKKKWKEFKNTSALKDILLATGIIGILYYLLFFFGLRSTSAGNASIIALSEIFFSFLFFNIWRKDYMPTAHIYGALFMLVGAVIVLFPNFTAFRSGDMMILLGAAIAPVGNFFQRRARGAVSSETILFIRSSVGAPVVFLVAYALGGSFLAISFNKAFLYLIINGLLLLGLSKVFWIEGILRINVAKAGALSSVGPLFTLLFAWLFLHNAPTIFQMLSLIPIGAGIILLGSNKKVW
ncbi:MAG: DMT family transporter [Parcubacteria group bacterium]|nr:DMT family transporter [Parcubacteria group bacterium]